MKFLRKNILFFFVFFVAFASLLLNFKLLAERQTFKPTSFKVLEVIDGDTFKIESGSETRRVRLMGINTPEAGKCLADKAQEKLKELVLGKDVILQDQFNDPYGRIMANAFIGNTYVNKEMLLLGLGRMDYAENPHKEELKAAYAKAREEKIGLFSQICISLIPPIRQLADPKSPIPCAIKGNLDDNTQKKSYYLLICKNDSEVIIDLSTEDQWFCSDAEAQKAGFTKSPNCGLDK